MSSTDLTYEHPEWQDTITVYFYGDGETFPLFSSVEVSPEDTVAGLKDHIFNKADDKGFDMAGFDQESMEVDFRDVDSENPCFYSNETKLKDFEEPCDVAFLPCFFSIEKRLGCGIYQAMLYLEAQSGSIPFKIEALLRVEEGPPSLIFEMEVSYRENVIGVKKSIIRRLFPDKNLLPSDVILIFSAGLDLKHVSIPDRAKSVIDTSRHLFVSVADGLNVKTFLEYGKLTTVDILLLNNPDE
ncbi:hypothetical protein BG005_001681 [Podila minutissima]|nr:hypothetical protein BG005_001681 [Podila minutissima]